MSKGRGVDGVRDILDRYGAMVEAQKQEAMRSMDHPLGISWREEDSEVVGPVTCHDCKRLILAAEIALAHLRTRRGDGDMIVKKRLWKAIKKAKGESDDDKG